MDGSTFMKLYIPLRSTILEVCKGFMSDPEEASDMTQDVYLKLWEQRSQLEDIVSPKAYAITLARNKCLDRLRSSAHKLREMEEPSDALPQMNTQTDTPLNRLIAKEQVRSLQQWVAQLPPQQQEIFKLRHYEMLDNQEIADRLNLKEVTVRSIVSRLRKEARTIFSPDGTKKR